VEEVEVEVGTACQRRVRLRMEVPVAVAVAVEEAVGNVRGKTEPQIRAEEAVDSCRV
jgi:hypothetical protein